jgi:DNA-binding SARP family transcriptional activator
MSKRLELQLLGRLEIQQDGMLLNTIQADKTIALLSYLAVTGRSHTRSAMAGLLWGGLP